MIFLLKSKGYHAWVFKGLEPGVWFIGVYASRAKLWSICVENGIKRKVLGLPIQRKVGGWIKNEGLEYFGFKNIHRGQTVKKALNDDWEDYGYEFYEYEVNGTKFEPFTFREKQELIYYDTNNIIDIENLIKNSAITEMRWISN